MKRSLLFLVLLFACQCLASTSVLTGTIKDLAGNPLTGTLVMSLPVPAQDQTSSVLVAAAPVVFRVIGGSIQGGAQLYDVANLQPQGLYYVGRLYDQTGRLVMYGNYAVTGGTFNIGTAVPTAITTSNISYAVPVIGLSGNNTWTGSNTFNQTLRAIGYTLTGGASSVGFDCPNDPLVGAGGTCVFIGQLAASGINVNSQKISFNALNGAGSNVVGSLQFNGVDSTLQFSAVTGGGIFPRIISPGFGVLAGGTGYECPNDPLTGVSGVCLFVGAVAASGNNVVSQNVEFTSTNNVGATVLSFIFSGRGAPAGGACVAGTPGLYIRTDGAASTTLYVCDSSGTWTAVTVP